MIDGWAVSHAALVTLVRGLQLAALVTWASVVLIRGGSLIAVLFAGSRTRWNRQWASITWMAATNAGFALRWVTHPDALARMGQGELAFWAVLYVSSCLSAIGVTIEHGSWTDARHRAAMWLHAGVVATCAAAAALIG